MRAARWCWPVAMRCPISCRCRRGNHRLDLGDGDGARVAPAWPDNALVWEASDPYLYMRATLDGRVIIGGADETDVEDAGARL